MCKQVIIGKTCYLGLRVCRTQMGVFSLHFTFAFSMGMCNCKRNAQHRLSSLQMRDGSRVRGEGNSGGNSLMMPQKPGCSIKSIGSISRLAHCSLTKNTIHVNLELNRIHFSFRFACIAMELLAQSMRCYIAVNIVISSKFLMVEIYYIKTVLGGFYSTALHELRR